jgi:hypothetical protein
MIWSAHINEMSRRLNFSVHSLKRLPYFLPYRTIIILAYAFLLSILDCADVRYTDITEELMNKLERLQNLAAFSVFENMTVYQSTSRNYSGFPFATGEMCISLLPFIKFLKFLIPLPTFVLVSNYFHLLPAPGVRVSLRHSNAYQQHQFFFSLIHWACCAFVECASCCGTGYSIYLCFQKSIKESLPLFSFITIVYNVV